MKVGESADENVGNLTKDMKRVSKVLAPDLNMDEEAIGEIESAPYFLFAGLFFPKNKAMSPVFNNSSE